MGILERATAYLITGNANTPYTKTSQNNDVNQDVLRIPISKLSEDKRLFAPVPLFMHNGEFHVGGVVVSPEATRKLQQQLRVALGKAPMGLFPGIDPKPLTLLVVTNKEQTKLERVFVGARKDGEVLVVGQLNLDPHENPSGAFQPLIEGKDATKLIRVELISPSDSSPPSKKGLQQIKTLMDSGDLVKADQKKQEAAPDVTLAEMAQVAPRTPMAPPTFRTAPAMG